GICRKENTGAQSGERSDRGIFDDGCDTACAGWSQGMSLHTLQPGDELPAVSMRGLDRAMLARYAGASGDYMPLHTDIDQARAAGLPDVIGHGMLVGAWMARVLTNVASPSCIRSFSL